MTCLCVCVCMYVSVCVSLYGGCIVVSQLNDLNPNYICIVVTCHRFPLSVKILRSTKIPSKNIRKIITICYFSGKAAVNSH